MFIPNSESKFFLRCGPGSRNTKIQDPDTGIRDKENRDLFDPWILNR